MSTFVNTVDVLGDIAVTDSIIDRSIAEYCDDTVESIGLHSLMYCANLQKVDFPNASSIGVYAFYGCSALSTVILRSENVCALANSNALLSTPIKSKTGYIYVPSSLVNSYKAATNWSAYANQIRAIEDYPDICGG